MVVVGLGPGGESAATQLAQAGLDGRRRRPAAGRRRVPLLRLHPEQDDDPGRRRAGRGAAGRGPRRRRARSPRTGRRCTPGSATRRPTDWDDQVAVDRLVDAGVTLRARRRPARPAPRTVEVDGDDVRRDAGASCSTPAPSRRPRRSTGSRTRRTGPTATPCGSTELPGLADRDRRRRDRRRAGAGVLPVRRPGHGARGGRPASSRPRSRRPARWSPRCSRQEGIQVLTGATIASVAYADGQFTGRGRRRRRCTPTSCWWRPAAGPTSPTSGWTPSASTRPPGRSRSTSGCAPADGPVGDRRHHRQGRVHAHVDVPGRRSRCATSSARTGPRRRTTRCRT